MEKNNIISIPEGINYLSEYMDELPTNCLLDKGKTGCGGTELVLNGNKNAIIAVPYISLITNKLEKTVIHEERKNEILGFYGKIQEHEVTSYLKTHPLKKIMVTYDSLPKLVEIIQKIDNNETAVFSDYFLLVDEWQCLFNYYLFRGEAIRRMIPVCKSFKAVTFMTATPLSQNYTLHELREYPTVKIEWANKISPSVYLYQTNDSIQELISFIIEYLQEYPERNFHIFMNSVEMIVDFLESVNITPEDAKIVCSKNNEKNFKKLAKLPVHYEICEPSDTVKKINLYTSTAFEGCDIFDEDGVSIIVSSGNREQTLIDIRTTVPQICGRIRNSKHKNILYFIYSYKKKKDLGSNEYYNYVKEETEKYTDFCNEANDMKECNREIIIKLLHQNNKNSPYLYIDENKKIYYDRNRAMVEVYRYILFNKYYTSKEMMENFFTKIQMSIVLSKQNTFKTEPSEKLAEKTTAKPSLKDLYEEYHSLRTTKQTLDFSIIFKPKMRSDTDEKKFIIEKERPFIKSSYDTLGIEKIRELEYKKKLITKEMLLRDQKPKETKVMELLEQQIEMNKLYPLSKLNEILKEMCELVELNPIPPASRIDNYFITTNKEPKIDGKTTKCKIIIKRKTLQI